MRTTGRGYVYFASTNDPKRIKVGFTINIYNRMASLSTASSEPFRVRRAFLTDYPSEALIHKRFSEDRIRAEWFHMSFDMEDLLDDIMDYQMAALGYRDMTPVALENVYISPDKVKVILDTIGDDPWPAGFVPLPEGCAGEITL